MSPKTGPDDFLAQGGTVTQLRSQAQVTERPFIVHGSGYRAIYGDWMLEAKNISRERDTLYAKVALYHSGRWVQGDDKLNLGSSRTRAGLANLFRAATPDGQDWTPRLGAFCQAILERTRLGAPVEYLDVPPKTDRPHFVVSPAVLDNSVTLLYGDGEAGKSFYALYIAFVAQLGLRPIAPMMLGRTCPVLYLDFEWDIEAHRQRTKQLSEGMRIPAPRIAYRSMAGVHLPDDVDRVADIIAEEGAGLVIVDSVAWALNKPLKDAEAAQELYAALNSLPGAKLAIHHETHEGANSQNAEAFGSRYFRHGARLSWRMRGEKRDNVDTGLRAMICTKFNAGPRFQSFAVRFDCAGMGAPACFREAEMKENPDWVTYDSAPSQWNAVLSWLVAHPKSTAEEIAEGVALSHRTVLRYLAEYSNQVDRISSGGGRGHHTLWIVADRGMP